MEATSRLGSTRLRPPGSIKDGRGRTQAPPLSPRRREGGAATGCFRPRVDEKLFMPSDEDPNYCPIAVNLMTASTNSCGLLVGIHLNNDFQGEPAAVAPTERQPSHVESTSENKEATDRWG